MVKTKYSRNAWKQLLQRLQAIPESSWRTNETGGMLKCRKHTDLVMKALRDTADNTGHVALYIFLLAGCK